MPKILGVDRFIGVAETAKYNIDLGVGTVIDWSIGTLFHNDISAGKGYTFLNAQNGQTVIVTVKNTSGVSITVTFPTALSSNFTGVVSAGAENVYTFIKSNNKVYVNVIDGMV